MEKIRGSAMKRGFTEIKEQPYDPEDVDRAKWDDIFGMGPDDRKEGGFCGRPKGEER